MGSIFYRVYREDLAEDWRDKGDGVWGIYSLVVPYTPFLYTILPFRGPRLTPSPHPFRLMTALLPLDSWTLNFTCGYSIHAPPNGPFVNKHIM